MLSIQQEKKDLWLHLIRCKIELMKSRDLIKILKENGWVLERIKGSHHIFTKSGCRSVPVPVHKGTDIPEKLAARILKEAGIK